MTTTTLEPSAAELDELEALAALDALGPIDGAAEKDGAPARRRRSSGSSRADRKAKAGDAPAKARTARAPRKSPAKIADGMANLYTMAGLAVSAVPSAPAVGPMAGGEPGSPVTVTQVIGQSLAGNAVGIGAAWEQAAKDDPRIREALERLLVVSTFGAILTAHAPVMIAGLMAGGMVPAALAAAADGI